MAFVTTYEDYSGEGETFLKRRGVSAKKINIGLHKALNFAISEETKTQPENRFGVGGVANTKTTISNFEGTLTLQHWSVENLAIALRGESTLIATGTVTDEPHNDVFAGDLVRTDFVYDPEATVTVKKGAATLVLDTDYALRATGSGILLIEGGAVIDGDDINISYTKNKFYAIEGLVVPAYEYELFFDGINTADANNPVPLDIFRVKFGFANSFAMKGSEFTDLEIKFSVLSDPSKTGPGKSKYLKFGKVAA